MMNARIIRLRSRVEGKIKRISPKIYFRLKENQKRRSCRIHFPKRTSNFLYLDHIAFDNIYTKEFDEIVIHYINHRFDILGSGWISYNKDFADGDIYKKIVWNRDFRSGYIWENADNSVGNYKNPSGSDVKNVWELGRLQHLVRIAIYTYKNRETKYYEEYKNQLIDFVNSNPIYEGIHWTCSMEVAIRAMNIIYSYDLLRQIDFYNIFDDEFDNIIQKYIYAHGLFIIQNLEFVRGRVIHHNHYYADIVGLLFLASYFKNKKWYKFAKKEFIEQTKGQFLLDGANIEGSTCYHKLCHELLQLGVTILIREDGVCNKEVIDTLNRATEYLNAIADYEDNIPQIGDNDSGTIFRISFRDLPFDNDGKGDSEYSKRDYDLIENTRNVWSNKERVSALYSNGIVCGSERSGEYMFIKSICRNTLMGMNEGKIHKHNIGEVNFKELKYTTVYEFKGNNLKDEAVGWRIFENIGIAVYKSRNAYVCVNIGKQDKDNYVGHLHDDVLHMDIRLNKVDYVLDPGTVTYTGNEKIRNEYRSHLCHFVPTYNGKMDDCMGAPFTYNRKCIGCFRGCDYYQIHMTRTMDYIVHHRYVYVFDNLIRVIDTSDYPFTTFEFTERYNYSDTYGSIVSKSRNIMPLIKHGEGINENIKENQKNYI